MRAGSWFGALFGVAVVLASRLGTMAWRVMWLAVGIQLAVTATLVWQRTRLPRQVRQRSESATLADLLLFRHIPYLR